MAGVNPCISKHTGNLDSEYAPWYVIPADDKEMARYIVAKIIWEEMQKHTDIKEPELDEKVMKDIEMYKEILKKE